MAKEMDKRQWVIALTTFLGGYNEILGGYASAQISQPLSSAAGAAIGELLCDYVLFSKSESKKELNIVFNTAAHAFIWSWIASMIASRVALPFGNTNLLVAAVGAFGATNFKNTWNLF